MAFFQYERGAINEERLQSVLQPLKLSDARMRRFWERNQMNFSQGYRDYINKMLAARDRHL